MKNILIAILIIGYFLGDHQIENSVWTCKVGNGCFDKLIFRSNKSVIEYDCELDYTFHSSYMVIKDTLIIKEKDDSHSEDNGKIAYYRKKFLIKNNVLYPLSREELVNKKWSRTKTQMDKTYMFRKTR